MTFDLRAILISVIAAVLYAGLLPRHLRAWAVLIGSVVAIDWLQPPLPIRFSDFILPTVILGLTVTKAIPATTPGPPSCACSSA